MTTQPDPRDMTDEAIYEEETRLDNDVRAARNALWPVERRLDMLRAERMRRYQWRMQRLMS